MWFGAFGGKAELMQWFDPRRKDGFQHAGTFNNNVLTMNAGYVGLTEVYTPERRPHLNDFGEGCASGLTPWCGGAALRCSSPALGSMIGVHMTDAPISSEADALKGNAALLDLFYFDLLARGLWFAKRGMMALSIALDAADADKLVAAVEDFAETRALAVHNRSHHPHRGRAEGVRAAARNSHRVDLTRRSRSRPPPSPHATGLSRSRTMSDTRANHRVAYFNGKIVPEREVVLPFRDRGFKYGDAAFDMTRTFQGRPFKLRSTSTASTARCAICGSIPVSARPRWSRSARRCSTATGIS